MAVAATRPSVGTTASIIAENTTNARGDESKTVGFLLKNATGTASVFLGGSDVTTGNGFEWAVADGALPISLEPGEKLYGRVASGTQTVHALKAGR